MLGGMRVEIEVGIEERESGRMSASLDPRTWMVLGGIRSLHVASCFVGGYLQIRLQVTSLE